MFSNIWTLSTRLWFCGCKTIRRNYSKSKHIEIEAKFKFTPEVEKYIKERSIFIGEKTFTDTYLDTSTFELTCRDIWFRKRDLAFECKIPVTTKDKDSFQIDRYEELTLEEDIQQYLISHIPTLQNLKPLPMFKEFLESAKIAPFASITTTR